MSTVTTKRELNGSRRVQFYVDGESKTEQHHRESVNINSIMSRYRQTRMLPQFGDVPRYGDFSQVGSFAEAATQVREAEALFLKLPSSIRARFENDPGRLIDFMSDAGNLDEAMELGLVERVAPSVAPEPGPAKAAEPAKPAGQEATPVADASGGE